MRVVTGLVIAPRAEVLQDDAHVTAVAQQAILEQLAACGMRCRLDRCSFEVNVILRCYLPTPSARSLWWVIHAGW